MAGTLLLSALPLTAYGQERESGKKEEKMETGTIHLTKAEFLQKVWNYEANSQAWKYEGSKPAIVDFFATWCGPCKALSPVLEELAKEYGDRLVIYKVDVDQERELAGAFGVRSVPTLLFIPADGERASAEIVDPAGDPQKHEERPCRNPGAAFSVSTASGVFRKRSVIS